MLERGDRLFYKNTQAYSFFSQTVSPEQCPQKGCGGTAFKPSRSRPQGLSQRGHGDLITRKSPKLHPLASCLLPIHTAKEHPMPPFPGNTPPLSFQGIPHLSVSREYPTSLCPVSGKGTASRPSQTGTGRLENQKGMMYWRKVSALGLSMPRAKYFHSSYKTTILQNG